MNKIIVTGNGTVSLYSLLNGKLPQAVCGGKGTCGKCLVKLTADGPSLLACRTFPSGECTVFLPGETEKTDETGYRALQTWDTPPFKADLSSGWGIALDIGTTTIAAALVDLSTALVVGTASALNSQRRFGADILSRVQSALDGHALELRTAVQTDISGVIRSLLGKAGIRGDKVLLITLSANMTMVHLLLGLSCETLGVAPFTPVMTEFPEYCASALFGEAPDGTPDTTLQCPVRIIPAVSTFIGGDIVSGLAALDLALVGGHGSGNGSGNAEKALFLDIGTNAEIVLAAQGAFWCTSAAAGPVFEGGNISCGTGSVSGAVSVVSIEDNRFSYHTIGNLKPSGICGSGLLDFAACALETGLIRKDGSVVPACEKTGILLDAAGALTLTQKDIRELQTAKAAVRAGIEVLLSAASVKPADISRVYLAGGFGSALNVSSALTIGLLPPSFQGKISPCGNTSLAGAVRFLQDVFLKKQFNAIMQQALTIQLADDPSFVGIFINSMEF